ncbi:C-1-tetrahydrofolate synthase, cytoplasmic [Nymphon striatum]|nr:C-1-tetrahydrofolate synthase, cytoplasmic [Nymphon striatum]
MSINKAQGQSLMVVGVDLTKHCFSYDQLYAVCSQVGSSKNFFILAPPNESTKNVVEIREEIRQEIVILKQKDPNFYPHLVIVQVGGREDSNVYIRMKLRAADEVGIKASHKQLPSTITEQELIHCVKNLNADPSVHGIIVQLPLDCVNHIDSDAAINSVSVEKDVDGYDECYLIMNKKTGNKE